jgi:hypothetical protein
MRNKLLLIAVLAITLTACEKEQETVFVPTPETASWYIYLDGQPSDPFRLVFSGSLPPYSNTWEYTNILCCNISPILVRMELNKGYTVSYMGRDSVEHHLFHAATKPETFRDTVPATTY